jgi:hypothetical protein
MKKLFIAVLALGLLISCKDKKNGDDKKTENREKDDYQKKDDDKNADFKNDDNGKADVDDNGNTNFGTKKGWPQSERDAFVSSCIREAEKGGTSRSVAQRYCDCMLIKIEGLYPDINDAAKLSELDIENILSKYRDACLQ